MSVLYHPVTTHRKGVFVEFFYRLSTGVFGIIRRMNIPLVLAAALVSTNLVVFTDIHKPEWTYNLHGTRTVLVIRDGLIRECRSEGVFDLANGLPEAEARRMATATRQSRGGLVRPQARTNAVESVTR